MSHTNIDPRTNNGTGAKSSSTITSLSGSTDKDYCQHGITYGHRCRQCNGERKRNQITVRETSLEAFLLPTPRQLSGVKLAVIELLATPMTDDQLYKTYLAAGYPQRTRQRIGTARSDLTKQGLIVFTGKKAPSELGNSSMVWQALPVGGEA